MASHNHQLVFLPVISCIQKIALYEDKNMFYLIGSNNNTSRFRVLKIDRTDNHDLTVVDDEVEYTQTEIHKLLERIESAHRSRTTRTSPTAKLASAFGIVGFVKFTEGYYLILVTKRQHVAIIGHHIIYKIKDISLTYIPHDVIRSTSPTEVKYSKIFQNIDLSSNFYFSYSYDLTHTLQYNLAQPSDFPLDAFQSTPTDGSQKKQKTLAETLYFGVRSNPNERFVWNWNLLKPVMKSGVVHPDWKLHIIHGFVDQSNVSVYGRSIHVSLIARRSRKYAGTRFLKRGANFEGDVANEVETEQIVHDACMSSFTKGQFSSFVQLRGSIPGHWSQDVSKMVPKPQIGFDLSDPCSETSGKHFNQLLHRYGSPIIILNLVKKREAKKQESVLTEEYIRNVKYLNQFLPSKHQIRYMSFDMARMNKTKEENVMQRLADIARSCVLKTGIFVSRPQKRLDGTRTDDMPQYQTGVVRVNCVDCLDRTNTAQFAVGRWALGLQLCALGVLRSPNLEFDTDCVRMLEALYEDHGDTLALQYGGSQLVHRIKTYRKTAPWTSQGNDIMQTLSRYYSNTFSDSDKQNTINLFLGLFQPSEKGPHIWEMFSDYYLHQSRPMGAVEKRLRPITQWLDPEMLPFLPRSYDEVTKRSLELYALRPDDEVVDGYEEYHKPNEMTNLRESFTFEISHSVRDFMPNFTTNFSPFAVRVRAGRRREEGGKQGIKNPSLTGESSTSSTTSSGTSSSAESEDSLSDVDLDVPTDEASLKQDETRKEIISFASLFPSMLQVYGVEPKMPSKADNILYRRYERIQKNSIQKPDPELKYSYQLLASSKFSTDSTFSTMVPTVPTKSIKEYMEYVSRGVQGASQPKKSDMDIYQSYASRI